MTYYPVIHDYNVCEKFSYQDHSLKTIDPLSV